MTNPTRERAMTTPCPHCSGELRLTEVGVLVEESSEPVKWSPLRRRCARGCQLIAGQVPEDAP